MEGGGRGKMRRQGRWIGWWFVGSVVVAILGVKGRLREEAAAERPRYERFGMWLKALAREEAEIRREAEGRGVGGRKSQVRGILRRLVGGGGSGGGRGVSGGGRGESGGGRGERGDEGRLRIVVESDVPLERWQEKGLRMEVTGRIGPFASVWLEEGEIEKLGRMEGLKYAEISRGLKLHLDQSGPLVGATEARLQEKVDGRGVIVGIVDTGIDLEHPAFRREGGESRVLAIMDYSQVDPKTQRTPRFLYKEEIDRWLKEGKRPEHEDPIGHGTHIAGIAAGNGRSKGGEGERYVGMAPQADLVIVKAIRASASEFDSGDVIDSIAFIHQFAKLSKKPYVINLSLGGHYGGHDGQSFLERASLEYSGEGKGGQILVASAGNEGEAAIHAEGWLRAGRPVSLRLAIPEGKEGKRGRARVAVEIWYPEEGEVSVEIRTPRGQRIGPLGEDGAPTSGMQVEEGWVAITRQSHQPRSASRSIGIVVGGEEESPLGWGEWEIRLSGKAERWDAWLTETRLPEGVAGFASEVSSTHRVGIPGTGEAFLTVGGFNSRRGWERWTGEIVMQGLVVGGLARFSSPGPTRDGRPKPEIVAPGIFVAAPAAKVLEEGKGSGLTKEKDYTVSQGTSQAAPHVSGAVALLLQKDPSLDLPTIRRLLVSSAKTDAWTRWGEVYQPGWGFGKLDIVQALRLMGGPSEGRPDPERSAVGAIARRLPADGRSRTRLYAIPKDRSGLALGGEVSVRWEASLGQIREKAGSALGWEAEYQAADRPGVAVIQAWAGEVRLGGRLEIELAEVDGYPSVGCGCSLKPGEQGGLGGFWWLALGGLWWVRRGSRRGEAFWRR